MVFHRLCGKNQCCLSLCSCIFNCVQWHSSTCPLIALFCGNSGNLHKSSISQVNWKFSGLWNYMNAVKTRLEIPLSEKWKNKYPFSRDFFYVAWGIQRRMLAIKCVMHDARVMRLLMPFPACVLKYDVYYKWSVWHGAEKLEILIEQAVDRDQALWLAHQEGRTNSLIGPSRRPIKSKQISCLSFMKTMAYRIHLDLEVNLFRSPQTLPF